MQRKRSSLLTLIVLVFIAGGRRCGRKAKSTILAADNYLGNLVEEAKPVAGRSERRIRPKRRLSREEVQCEI